jgi:Glycosyl transferase family 2
MSHVVIIASTRRPEVLADTVDSVLAGTWKPPLILLATPDEADVAPRTGALPMVRHIQARRGLCHQLNDAVAALPPDVSVVTVFDDDVELAPDYLERARAFLVEHPEICVFDGRVIVDGRISRSEAKEIFSQPLPDDDRSFHPNVHIYGCNFTSRVEMLRRHPFDERLPLYAWQFEVDYGIRCNADGKVGTYYGCRFVHLMVTSGRINGTRFGFSQIMNPYYLFKKKEIPLKELLAFFWIRSVSSNLLNSSRRGSQHDYRGRLKGNFLAFANIVRGRAEPEQITEIK